MKSYNEREQQLRAMALEKCPGLVEELDGRGISMEVFMAMEPEEIRQLEIAAGSVVKNVIYLPYLPCPQILSLSRFQIEQPDRKTLAWERLPSQVYTLVCSLLIILGILR